MNIFNLMNSRNQGLYLTLLGFLAFASTSTRATQMQPRTVDTSLSLEDTLKSFEDEHSKCQDSDVLRIAFWDHVFKFCKISRDPERCYALQLAVNVCPRFFINAEKGDNALKIRDLPNYYSLPVNEELKRTYEKRYKDFRSQVLADPNVSKDRRCMLEFEELSLKIRNTYTASRYAHRQSDVVGLQNEALEFAARYPKFWGPQNPIEMFFSYPKGFGLEDPKKMLAFISRAKMGPNAQLTRYVIEQERIAKLSQRPLVLSFTAMDGRKVNLQDMRGKVVLIDVWNTYCGSCIEGMPKIKVLYEKYKDQGFEVLGICYPILVIPEHPDKARKIIEHDQERARKVIEKLAITWPTFYMSPEEAAEIKEQLSIYTFPLTLVLDKNGKLITSNPDHESLEGVVRKTLGIPALANRK